MGKVQLLSTELSQKYVRYFDESLKRSIVERFEKKLINIREICELYSVSRTSVYKWIYQYSKHYKQGTVQVIQMESDTYKLKEYLKRIADLERVVGVKQLEIDYLHKLVEISSTELGVDIKKNFDTQSWNGSGKISNTTNIE
jgi:transposase-like protein